MGLFCRLGALFLGTAAAWQAYDRVLIERTWTPTSAEVVKCRTTQHASRRDGANDLWTRQPLGPTHSVNCAFPNDSTFETDLTAAMRQGESASARQQEGDLL